MLTGINHITIAINDLDESFDFYVSVLGMKPEVKWESGAYLTVGELWLCLSKESAKPSEDYCHISFSISKHEFKEYCSRVLGAGVRTWKDNTSEGKSLYILDPNGHKLEIHAGNLASRLSELRVKPYKDLEWF